MHKIIINILLGVMIMPILCLIFSVFMNQGSGYFIFHLFVEYCTNTLVLMFGTCFVTLCLGVGLAALVNFFNFPGKNIFKHILFMPLALPAYIMALVYTKVADDLHVFHISHYQSMIFAICVMGLCFYPYVYMIVSARFGSLMNTLTMARTMGKKPIEILFVLMTSMARPSIIAGSMMVLMEVISDFGAAQLFSIPTFTTGIYRNHFLLNNHSISSLLTLALLGFIYLIIYLEKHSRRKNNYSNMHHNNFDNASWNLHGLKAISAMLFCSIPVLLGFFLPVSILIFWSLKASISMDNIGILLYNTASVAFVATTISITMALLFSYALRMKAIKNHWLRMACMGYAVPGIVVAVTILSFLGLSAKLINFTLEFFFHYEANILLVGTIFAIIYSYVFRFLSLSVGSIESCLAKIPREFDMSVKMLGKSHFETLELYIPMIARGIYTAFILVFIEIIKELPATLIVRPFNFETFATKVYLLVADERYYDAAVPALMIASVGIISVLILIKLIYSKNLHNIKSNVRINCLCDICIGVKNEC